MKLFNAKMLIALALVTLCGGERLEAQTLNEAKAWYQEGKYEEAMPVFARFVKSAPNNGSYNHWYGVCLFETGDIRGAEKYLKVGMRRRVQESYRYLAEVYMKTYRFEEAVEMFEDYIEQLAKKEQDTAPWEVRLAAAEEGVRMLSKVERVEVIDSVVVDRDAILDAYVLSEESGKLMTYRDFFQREDAPGAVVYVNQKGNQAYYARPDEDARFHLFSQSKLMDGWGDEKILRMNTEGDENYPFVLPDGVTIYFASSDPGSLGGYDLFITRYNTETESYLNPECLGMPFNSPYNDYMMVYDGVKGLGWFASDRFQPEGMACVYLFIPTEERTWVDSEEEDEFRAWASLESIRVTQDTLTNYSERIALAHQEIPYGQKGVERDFIFPIDDQTVYYTLDEIQSSEARNLYQQALDLNRQIASLKESLEEKRKVYERGDASRKESLVATLLDEEARLKELLPQPAALEKEARNAEILYKRKHER